jgi:chromate transporter
MGRIAGNRRVAGSLSAIGAVVTAVIATLMLWFAHGVFLPHGSIALGSLVVAFMAFLLLQFKRAGIISLIVGCGLIGVVIRMVG